MPSVSRIKSLRDNRVRLLIRGEWSAEAGEAIAAGGCDVVEFHSGDYQDFTCLTPYADALHSIAIVSGVWKSAAGLETLHKLQSLRVGVRLEKDVDFSVLPQLATLNIEGWLPHYARTLFRCQQLSFLRLEGYAGQDCREIGQLTRLRRLMLAKGRLQSLQGLSTCAELQAIELSHLPRLTDIADIDAIATLREIELSESLPKLQAIDAIREKTALRRLSLRALETEWPDIAWLARFTTLDVLGIWNVVPLDWDSLLASARLKKLAVTFTRSTGLSLDRVREIATSHGLNVTDVKPIGVPAKQKGYLLECRPAGSTQNLWYWNDDQDGPAA
jgi:hypothetical protein